jgi:AraC-like DNA-binding protein
MFESRSASANPPTVPMFRPNVRRERYSGAMDPLAAVLRSLRLRSAVHSLAHMTGTWGVASPGMPGTMIFHGVTRGRCVLRRDGDSATHALDTGDVAFLARGHAHSLASASGVAIMPMRAVDTTMLGPVAVLRAGSAGDETHIVCGKCTLEHPAAAAVVELLPPVLVSRPEDETRRRWLSATLALLHDEVRVSGSTPQSVSLTDAVFLHLVAASATRGPGSGGLIAAARDEQIGRALAMIHDEPSREWTAIELAERIGMSRTRFFERFTELMGEPPAKYVARWRVLAAADLLRDRALSLQIVAERVGYSSEDSLGRAFKRHMGMSVGEWRRTRAA